LANWSHWGGERTRGRRRGGKSGGGENKDERVEGDKNACLVETPPPNWARRPQPIPPFFFLSPATVAHLHHAGRIEEQAERPPVGGRGRGDGGGRGLRLLLGRRAGGPAPAAKQGARGGGRGGAGAGAGREGGGPHRGEGGHGGVVLVGRGGRSEKSERKINAAEQTYNRRRRERERGARSSFSIARAPARGGPARLRAFSLLPETLAQCSPPRPRDLAAPSPFSSPSILVTLFLSGRALGSFRWPASPPPARPAPPPAAPPHRPTAPTPSCWRRMNTCLTWPGAGTPGGAGAAGTRCQGKRWRRG
jgi:hypothetical protein